LRRRTVVATTALVVVTAIWGATFVTVKHAIARMPVLDFLTWRFAIATLALVLLRPRSATKLGRRGWRAGALVGLALGLGYVFQTYGLRTTRASVSGFITGMFVVFTPLVAAFVLRQRVTARSWFAVALATAGLALISLRGFSIGGGEALTLLCAFAFAVHIVGLGTWAPDFDPVGLAVVQLTTVTVLCAVCAAPGSLAPPPDLGVWGAVLLTGLAATAFAFVVQTWAQAHLPPVRAAVVLTMEPVFAGVFGVIIGGDHLSTRILSGAVCVLVAMLIVESSRQPVPVPETAITR
jgi:drug/metabolite transporter (DMT)-like permease